MKKSEINAIIYFSHLPHETAALAQAIIPLGEQIRAVMSPQARNRMRHILAGDHFRRREAKTMCDGLKAAANYGRLHLSDYFPVLQGQVMADIETLETAVAAYLANWRHLEDHVIPVR